MKNFSSLSLLNFSKKLPIYLAAFCYPLVSPVGLSQEKSVETTDQITFVAYNLKNYLGMDRKVDGEVKKDAGKPEREIKPLIEGLLKMQPDILGVSEIGDDPHLVDLQARLKAGGLDLPHVFLLHAQSGWERNLAILSKFPIVENHSRDDLKYTIGDQLLPFQRGIIDCTVMPNPNYRLRLVGLHLKSKREVDGVDQSLMRLNEAKLARDHIDKILAAEPGANLLVFGDLNDTQDANPIREIRGRFGRPDYLTAIGLKDQYGFKWTHYWSWADIYARIDFAMLSKGISPEVSREESYIFHWEEWDTASDHRPLVLKIIPVDKATK
ncbi:MAG: endonuclease/exonuclease/phosphatase family protein [Verrucomicrobiales bacterium]